MRTDVASDRGSNKCFAPMFAAHNHKGNQCGSDVGPIMTFSRVGSRLAHNYVYNLSFNQKKMSN